MSKNSRSRPCLCSISHQDHTHAHVILHTKQMALVKLQCRPAAAVDTDHVITVVLLC